MSLIEWKKPTSLFPTINFPNLADTLFRDDDFFDGRWMARELTVPSVNVKETKEAFNLEIAVPGMKKSDFKLEVKDGALVVSAETKSEKEEKGEQYTRKEFNFSSFSRSFWLPENVKTDNIKAQYNDGILKVVVPRMEVKKETPVKQIAIA
jgi:HSP20 family protein